MKIDNSEYYLIILWEKSKINPQTVKDKVNSFNMTVELTEGKLEKNYQHQFIKQLYFKSITNFDEKIKRVGCNKIHVGIIKDENPNYHLTPTTRGFQLINKNIFQLKRELRELSSVSDGVHISDTKEESKHNIFLAFSIAYEAD
jgi:sulfite reductase beta subunit-like hemoprotein